MISIRAQLLWSLLPAIIAITIAAGFGIFFSTKSAQEAQLDAQLATLAFELRFTDRGPERGNERGFRRRNKKTKEDTPGRDKKAWEPDFQRFSAKRGGAVAPRLPSTFLTNLPTTVYCEIIQENGLKNIKSSNLGDERISPPEHFSENPTFYDATANDRSLRAWATSLALSRESQNPKVILAIDRTETDEILGRLAYTLLAGGATFCGLVSLILILALRLAMKPLQKLGMQAAAMDAEQLHERFSEKGAPADIRPIIARLNNLIAKLEESFARERRFSGDLAHELRTPLAAIRTTSEVAIKWPQESPNEEFEEILNLSTGLQQTLDSLLLLSRMESASAEKNCETVDIIKLANECQALHASKAKERRLIFESNFSPISIETDPRLLRIILTNLIGNAVSYAPEGSTIMLCSNDSTLFECQNAAPNLSQDDVSHLFERMWRKDKARTDSAHAGLGLSIAQACTHALNLNIRAEQGPSKQLKVMLFCN